jgi:hypothetical protein
MLPDTSHPSGNIFEDIKNNPAEWRRYECIRLGEPNKITKEIRDMLSDHNPNVLRNINMRPMILILIIKVKILIKIKIILLVRY